MALEGFTSMTYRDLGQFFRSVHISDVQKSKVSEGFLSVTLNRGERPAAQLVPDPFLYPVCKDVIDSEH